MCKMCQNAAEKDTLVSYGERFISLLGICPEHWLYEGKDPDEEVGGRLVLCC